MFDFLNTNEKSLTYIQDLDFSSSSPSDSGPFDLENTVFWADDTAEDGVFGLNTLTHLNANGLLVDGSLGRPADWDDTSTRKIIVLMTDGFITFQNRASSYTSVSNLQKKMNGTVVTNRATTTARLLEMYDLEKHPSRDVGIYTVAFETSSAAGAIMEQCATGPSYYNSASGAGLVEVFQNIAQQITALRLTQ